MKKIWFGLLFMCCSQIHAEQLNHFDDIRNSILNGNNIKLLINFSECMPKINDLTIYTVPHDIALHKNYLEFADVPYITDTSNDAHASVDFENVTYKLTDAGELHFHFKSIMLTGASVSVDESTTICPLTTAVKVFSAN